MCHVSCVTCHLSRVTCHLSHVTCHLSHVKKKKKLKKIKLKKITPQKILDKVVEPVGGGSVINGAYPVYFNQLAVAVSTSMTESSNTFCIKWNEFQTNIVNSYSGFRKNFDFSDITLVSDD